jgi:predicted MPP superfamily phosphohydrolase
MSSTLITVVCVVILLAMGCVGYGIFIEQHWFRQREITLPVLGEGHRPLRILHISDLHLLPDHTKKSRWVSSLIDTKPDFIINTGDNLSSDQAVGLLRQTLGVFTGIPGAYVWGSNDFHGPTLRNPFSYLVRPSSSGGESTDSSSRGSEVIPTDQMAEIFESLGWVNAEAPSTLVKISDTHLEIRGCGDAHIDKDHYQPLGASGADLLIGITHAPYRRVLDQMVNDGVDLVFCGHTHGGQVCGPGGRALTTNCDLPRRQAKGLSRLDHGDSSAWLHVSPGLGTSPKAPYRFWCRPEATLLTLVPRTGSSPS